MTTDDTLTLALAGDVSLEDFAQAIRAWRSLIDAIQKDKSITEARWIIDDLRASSAVARLRGIGHRFKEVITEYDRIGATVSAGRMPHSEPIRRAIYDLTGVIGNTVKSIRFETRENDSEILSRMSPDSPAGEIQEEPQAISSNSLGSVRGRIQSITSRKSLQFTIYDINSDMAVSCYLEPGSENFMRRVWGKIAIVSGLVRRNLKTGEITTVRHIKPENIQIIPEISGSWRDAIGASRSRKNEVLPEIAIRRGRDG